MHACPTLSPDKRRSPRYPLKDTFFLTFRPQFDRVGRLSDISSSGVSFEYTIFQKCEKYEYVEVDIFAPSQQLSLARVPCKVVYDCALPSAVCFQGVQTNRCGLEFGALNADQSAKLRSIINTHCLAPSDSVFER